MSYVDTIIDDMALFHDGPSDPLGPGGVSSTWGSGWNYPEAYAMPSDWSARIGTSDPPATLMWFHLGEDCVPENKTVKPWRYATAPGNFSYFTGNQSSNTRVQIYGLQLWELRNTGLWVLRAENPTPGSTMYPINWSNANATTNNTYRTESAGNGSGASIKTVGYGAYEDYMWHGWTSRVNVNAGVVGYATCCYARLILDNPAGTDDRHLAHLLLGCAGDYYYNIGVTNPQWPDTVNPIGYSRFKYVTNDWQLFSFYTGKSPWATISEAQLRANPPPYKYLDRIGASEPLPDPGDPPPTSPLLALPSVGNWFARSSGGSNNWDTHGVANTPTSKIRRRRGNRIWS